MKRLLSSLSIVIGIWTASILQAQDPNAFPKPQKEHEWLNHFVGEWESESVANMPGMPPMKCKGTMSARKLGGFWMIADIQGEMPGGMKMSAIQTLGYDVEKKKYIGTWVDTTLHHMWKYVGTLDESSKTLTLEADGPNFLQPGKEAKFRDAYEFKSKDHVVLTSSMQGADGKWTTFMTATLQRKK